MAFHPHAQRTPRRLGLALALVLGAFGPLACGLATDGDTRSLHDSRTERFGLRIDHAPSVDGGAVLHLHLTPVPPYKLATEFPIKVLYRAPANAPQDAQVQLRAEDARNYAEEGARFEWAAPASADVAIRFAFGVCRDEFCEPVEVDLEVPLPDTAP